MKDMLSNVGSAGGAAAAPTGGPGGATAETPAEEAKQEEKEEGRPIHNPLLKVRRADVFLSHRKGRIGRGHGLGSLRLDGAAALFDKLSFIHGVADTLWLFRHGVNLRVRDQISIDIDAIRSLNKTGPNHPSVNFNHHMLTYPVVRHMKLDAVATTKCLRGYLTIRR